MTRGLVLAALALLAAGPAAAQEADPTLNESDFDTAAPPADESYLDAQNETTSPEAEPTLGEDDFDTSAPPADESYLDAEEGGEDHATVPGAGVLLGVAAVGLAALAARRR